jgi:hypothetical protein
MILLIAGNGLNYVYKIYEGSSLLKMAWDRKNRFFTSAVICPRSKYEKRGKSLLIVWIAVRGCF